MSKQVSICLDFFSNDIVRVTCSVGKTVFVFVFTAFIFVRANVYKYHRTVPISLYCRKHQ
jgi:hypothetical protein